MEIGLGHLPASALPPIPQEIGVLVAELHFETSSRTNRLPGEVVLGGADPPGDNHRIRPLHGEFDRLGDAILVVTHHLLEVGIEAVVGEGGADRRCVGVDDLAKQQLGADCDDLDNHRTVASMSGPKTPVYSILTHSPGLPRSTRTTPSISGACR